LLHNINTSHVLEPLINKYFGFHEIFHLFVMLGSALHYWFIFRFVITM